MLRKLSEILVGKSQVAKLLKQTEQLAKLDAAFKKTIAPNLSTHCKIARIEKNELLLIIDNASFATEIHYKIPEILNSLKTKKEFQNILKIKYRLAKDSFGYEEKFIKKEHKKIFLSQKAASLITQAALSIKNERLQRGLLKIASHQTHKEEPTKN